MAAGRRARWTARSALHHSAGSCSPGWARAPTACPPAVRRAISLEGRAGARTPARGRWRRQRSAAPLWDEVAAAVEEGPAPCSRRPCPGWRRASGSTWRWSSPPFGRGSGGHSSIFQIVHWLERMGHTCTLWVFDPLGRNATERASVLRHRIVTEFAPIRAPVFKGFASGTARTWWWPPAGRPSTRRCCSGCRARAYLVHDHEPEFFGTSVERRWAERTYHEDLYPISSSAWLRD